MVEKNQEKRKILVTGSSGMLGTYLCEILARDYSVVGFDAVMGQDVTDRQATLGHIAAAKPEIIIHAAAWTDVDGCERDPKKANEINAAGTNNVADAARKTGALLIYISTDFVFDGSKSEPYSENDIPNPLSIYARTKLDGERIAEKADQHIIIRTSWLYGKNGTNFVDAILKKAKNGETLKVVNDQIGSPTYAKDLAKAILELFKTDNGIYHISNGGSVSWFDYAKEILRISGVQNVEIRPIKSPELNRPAKRPAFSVLDNAKFERLTGHKMRSWRESLKEYMNEKS